ncbi:MAG TPA: hypothetical protein VFM81_10490, partial [Actinomycetota bacterium]|nr:hypothetical protein [Actinomycetota bacterium]
TPSAVENVLRSSGPSIVDPLVGQSYHRLSLPPAIAALGVATSTPIPTTTAPPPLACTIQGTSDPDVLVGTAGSDVICGGGGGDVLVPNGGVDTIDGGNGFDFVSLDGASGGGTVDLTTGTASAPGITVSIQRIEGVIGTPFNDMLIGNGADNDFLGLGGDDAIDGGGGFDFVRYDFALGRVKTDLRQRSAQGEGADALTAVEGVVGGAKDDILTGDGTPNILVGLNGDDRLWGLGRPDTLIGGPGADVLFGGRGNDSLTGGPGADSCDVGPGRGSASSC